VEEYIEEHSANITLLLKFRQNERLKYTYFADSYSREVRFSYNFPPGIIMNRPMITLIYLFYKQRWVYNQGTYYSIKEVQDKNQVRREIVLVKLNIY
jgi:hypothetical protein